MMNYKPTSNKGEKLSTEQVANFLKVGKKEGDVYDDIMYYDDAKIKEIVLRQTFLIAKGYFDPKEYFQAIKIDNLDDQTFDNKIKAMFNWKWSITPINMHSSENEVFTLLSELFLFLFNCRTVECEFIDLDPKTLQIPLRTQVVVRTKQTNGVFLDGDVKTIDILPCC